MTARAELACGASRRGGRVTARAELACAAPRRAVPVIARNVLATDVPHEVLARGAAAIGVIVTDVAGEVVA